MHAIYMYIPKYNQHSPQNITYMHVFSDDLLSLDKKLLCSSVGKTTPLTCFDSKTPYSAPLRDNCTHS